MSPQLEKRGAPTLGQGRVAAPSGGVQESRGLCLLGFLDELEEEAGKSVAWVSLLGLLPLRPGCMYGWMSIQNHRKGQVLNPLNSLWPASAKYIGCKSKTVKENVSGFSDP